MFDLGNSGDLSTNSLRASGQSARAAGMIPGRGEPLSELFMRVERLMLMPDEIGKSIDC